MVIWPKAAHRGDEGWDTACALMRTLALSPRKDGSATGADKNSSRYYERATDYLVRPKIWVDKRRVDAPYFLYSIRFNVSASVHGRISIDDATQLAEFCDAIDAALQSDLTKAERRLWEATASRTHWTNKAFPYGNTEREADLEKAESFVAVAREESSNAFRNYNATLEALLQSGTHRPQLHERILSELIAAGSAQLKCSEHSGEELEDV